MRPQDPGRRASAIPLTTQCVQGRSSPLFTSPFKTAFVDNNGLVLKLEGRILYDLPEMVTNLEFRATLAISGVPVDQLEPSLVYFWTL